MATLAEILPGGLLKKKKKKSKVMVNEAHVIPCSDRHFYCVNLNKCYYWEQYFI